jgi:hypothetical protein
MKKNTRRAFDLFIKKARQLDSRNFAKYIKEKKLGIQFSLEDDSLVIENIGPDEDATHAFIPTLRLFIQDEPISLRSFAKFADDPDLSTEWKEEFTKARDTINQYLEIKPNLPIPQGEIHPTRREILDVLINGDIQHVKDERKRLTFERWATNGLYFVTLQNEFNSILLVLFKYIMHIAQLCETELNSMVEDKP